MRRFRLSLFGALALINQNCEGFEWKAKGDHPFVRAFLSRAQGGEEISGTSYQYGYVLRTALYQRK